MSTLEMKAELTRIIDTDDDVFLIEMLAFAKHYYTEDDGTLMPHETPEFFAELDQIDADIDSGKERTFSHEEFRDILYNRKPIP